MRTSMMALARGSPVAIFIISPVKSYKYFTINSPITSFKVITMSLSNTTFID